MSASVEDLAFVGEDGKYHTVYRITNLINGKMYVGVHSTFNYNDDYLGSGTSLRRSVDKYGRLNFKKEILFFCANRDSACQSEIFAIRDHRSIFGKDMLYNITDGGDSPPSHLGMNHTEEAKRKISEGHKGKVYSEETITKMKESKTGENNPNYGKPRSEETRKKISESNKGQKRSEELKAKLSEIHKGRKLDDETKKKISKANLGNTRAAKGIFYKGKYYETMTDAANEHFPGILRRSALNRIRLELNKEKQREKEIACEIIIKDY